MKKILEKLENYAPFNEQEEEDICVFKQFIEAFGDNIWTRENKVGHFSSSAWVVNRERTKVLMAYHKIYDSFAWLGGHADGDKDLLHVALKEVKEESGVEHIRVLSEDFIDVGCLFVKAHVKKGKPVSAHLHFNVTYLLEADEQDTLHIAEEENSAVRWIPISEVTNVVSEEHMKPVYARLMEKMKKF